MNQANTAEDEVTLFDYWQVIYKRKTAIITFCTVMVGATLVASLMMTKIFESTASLLPQLESNTGFGLGALLASSAAGSAAQSLGISLPGAPATPTDIFIAMLKSRIMADEVIRQFNLMEHYEKKT
ncbi:Wzz/FepE/Etk N-terminal domain-containing protein, partial [Petrachloros mirabilis]